jgi:hypothetical protein
MHFSSIFGGVKVASNPVKQIAQVGCDLGSIPSRRVISFLSFQFLAPQEKGAVGLRKHCPFDSCMLYINEQVLPCVWPPFSVVVNAATQATSSKPPASIRPSRQNILHIDHSASLEQFGMPIIYFSQNTRAGT